MGICAAHLEVQNTVLGCCRASGFIASPPTIALADCSTVQALNGNRIRIELTSLAQTCNAPAFAITVGDLFQGYRRYGRLPKPFIWCHNATKWRQDLADALSVDFATCFWRSLAFIATQPQVVALWGQVAQTTAAGVMDGVSPAQAVLYFQSPLLCNAAGLPQYSLYSVDPLTNRIGVLIAGQVQAGLVYVCLNDDGAFAPHWLPMTNYNQANAEPTTANDLLDGLPAMLAANALPAAAVAAFTALQQQFTALNPPPLPPVFVPPPAPPPPPPPPPAPHVPVVFYPPDCDGFVCFRDPPLADLGVLVAPGANLAPAASMFSRKLWVHTPNTAVGWMRLMEGKGPDFTDRLIAHGTGCGFCFELRPETLIGQEICERDYCFCEDSSPATRTHGLNLLGQYHIRFLSVVVTDGGTWRLRLVGRSNGVSGRFVSWYKFCKSAHDGFLSLLCDSIPCHTEKVLSVQMMTPVYVEPVCADFPTPDAWYRAMYQFLAQTVPPEVVAPLMTARNEEMSLQARSGKHPRDVADSLVRLWRQLQSELGTTKAFALT